MSDGPIKHFRDADNGLSITMVPCKYPFMFNDYDFSPSGEILYVGGLGGLLQFDATATNSSDLLTSMVQLSIVEFNSEPPARYQVSSVGLGPDGIIYVGPRMADMYTYGTISDPEVIGEGCNYNDQAYTDFTFLQDITGWGLPYWNYDRPDIVSVSENNTDQVQVYPNPVINEFTIDGLSGNEKIQIFDLYGELINSYKSPLDRYNISNLPNGIYFIKVDNSVSVKTFKVLKQ